jgi:hypothetical protein
MRRIESRAIQSRNERGVKPSARSVLTNFFSLKSLSWHSFLIIFFGIGTFLTVNQHKVNSPVAAGRHVANTRQLNDLLNLSPADLDSCDIALMDLVCAQSLPGAENINISGCLMKLDEWAGHVQSETERNLHRFRDNPGEFDNSEGYFRMLIMSVVMYEDFGVRYNPERIILPQNIDLNDHFFTDSRDIFLHGLIGDRRMGTCSSMPVLYIAIGRRLGYPLKLVTTKSHLFVRWESDTDRFNVEATGKGMNRYDDEHFKQWPFPVSDGEIRTEGYLKSLTASEELAVFLSLRGNCLKESGRLKEAANCFAQVT